MATTVDDNGLWQPTVDLEGFAWSPDDAYIAVWTANGTVRCVEAGTWREVLSIPGAAVGAVAWPTADVMWVVRQHGKIDARVIAHAVPDGGVMFATKLEGGWSSRHVMNVSAAGTVMVAPAQWPGESRGNARTRLAWVLTANGEIRQKFDPHDYERRSRQNYSDQCRAALSPDGARVALAYGSLPSAHVLGPSRLSILDLHSGAIVSTRATPSTRVQEVLWAGSSTVVVRSDVNFSKRPEQPRCYVFVVVTDRETQRYRAVGRTSVALHRDRSHLLLVGDDTMTEHLDPPPTWRPTVSVVDLQEGSASPPRLLKARSSLGVGATWFGHTSEFAVLVGRGTTVAALSRWLSIDDGPVGEMNFKLHGTKPSNIGLDHSAAGHWLTAHWHSNPPKIAPSHHLTVIPVSAVQALGHRP